MVTDYCAQYPKLGSVVDSGVEDAFQSSKNSAKVALVVAKEANCATQALNDEILGPLSCRR